MKYCPKCKKPVEDGEKFCISCGCRLDGRPSSGGFNPLPYIIACAAVILIISAALITVAAVKTADNTKTVSAGKIEAEEIGKIETEAEIITEAETEYTTESLETKTANYLRDFAKSTTIIFHSGYTESFTDIRFLLEDMSDDGIPELIVMTLDNYEEIGFGLWFVYSCDENGKIEKIFEGNGAGFAQHYHNPVRLSDSKLYIFDDGYASGSGYCKDFQRYDGSDWVSIYKGRTYVDWETNDSSSEYTADGVSVSYEEYEKILSYGKAHMLTKDDFLTADEL